jgi:hypothetical protein
MLNPVNRLSDQLAMISFPLPLDHPPIWSITGNRRKNGSLPIDLGSPKTLAACGTLENSQKSRRVTKEAEISQRDFPVA